MQFGITGGVELDIINHTTSEVKCHEMLNLITNYGLSRLFAPCNLNDKTANVICFGYKADDPAITEDTIPANYYIADASENFDVNPTGVNNSLLEEGSTRALWVANVNRDSIPYGTQINHIYLGYRDENGIVKPLTSLKLRDKTGQDLLYTHSEETGLQVRYSIMAGILVGENEVSELTGISYRYGDNTNLRSSKSTVIGYEIDGLGAHYSINWSRPTQQDYTSYEYIKGGDGAFNEDGEFVQKYILETKPGSNRSMTFRVGLGYIYITFSGYRTRSTLELSFIVKQLVLAQEPARPVTSLSGSKDNYNTRFMTIMAPPNQWVDIYYKNVLIQTAYVGVKGVVTIVDQPNYDIGGRRYDLTSGNLLKLVSRTLTSTATVELVGPDLQADDLIAIWWINPNTLRIVSRSNDTIKLFGAKHSYRDSDLIEDLGINARTDIPFPEDPTYFYCDVQIPDYTRELYDKFGYQVIDLAGNLFDNRYGGQNSYTLFYIKEYLPGQTYAEALAVRSFNSASMSSNADTNEYGITLRLLSGEIR